MEALSMIAGLNFAEFLQMVMTPIARFCLRHSLGLHDVVEATKMAFIRAAEEEFSRQGMKTSISRLSVATGVHRKDTTRIVQEGALASGNTRLTGKIIQQWRRSKRFQTGNGKPRTLTFEGDSSEFAALVRAVSSELKPGSVLFDLERIGAVERTRNGLRLKTKSYVPRGNPAEGFRMLAGDTEDLIEAVTTNIFWPQSNLPNYHGKATFDNICPEHVPAIRSWLTKQCSNLHHRVMKHVSQFDLDLNPSLKKRGKTGGARIALGMFTRTEESEPSTSDE